MEPAETHLYSPSSNGLRSPDEHASSCYDSAVKPSAPRRPHRNGGGTLDQCGRANAALSRGFDLLGKRWTGVVLGTLAGGPAGFGELGRAVEGISDSVLSERLNELSEAGLVTRTVSAGPPLSVAYALTPAGRALLPALEQISRWAEKHLPAKPRRALGGSRSTGRSSRRR
jgi:DNA-binding HxlR family transcriptional regulator